MQMFYARANLQITLLHSLELINMLQNGLISGIPFLLKSILSYLSGVITDVILKKKLMSKTTVRSWSTFISMYPPHLYLRVCAVTSQFRNNNSQNLHS